MVQTTKARKKKQVTGPKKKGRRGWTTDEQEEFLKSQIPAYLSSKASKVHSDFWPPLWEEYFERWPPEPPCESKDEPEDEGDGNGDVNIAEKGQDDDKCQCKKTLCRKKKKVRLLLTFIIKLRSPAMFSKSRSGSTITLARLPARRRSSISLPPKKTGYCLWLRPIHVYTTRQG